MAENNKKMITVYLVTVFFVVFDRFFKDAALGGLFDPPVFLIGNIFSFGFVKNYYIAFSIPLSGWLLNGIIILITLGLVVYWLYSLIIKKRDYGSSAYLFLIIAGAFSNLADRLRLGYVIDYFDLKYFTVFNLADMMIVGGVIGLGWMMVFQNKKDA